MTGFVRPDISVPVPSGQKAENLLFYPFREEYLTAVQILHVHSTLQLAPKQFPFTPEQLAAEEIMIRDRAYLTELLASHLTVAFDGLEIIATAGWSLHEAGVGRVRKMFVGPKYANRKLGRRLLARVEREIREQGISSAVVRSSMNAIGFYEKHGYARSRQEIMNLPDGVNVPVVWMLKTLV